MSRRRHRTALVALHARDRASGGRAFALIGGYALALQGIVCLTEGVDVLVEPSVETRPTPRRSAERSA